MNASYLSSGPRSPISAIQNAHAAPLPVAGIHHSCCREILRLNHENARLHRELERMRAQHEDLTRSAELWIRLYERQLQLASARTAASCRP